MAPVTTFVRRMIFITLATGMAVGQPHIRPTPTSAAGPAKAARLRASSKAVERALPLLQQSARTWTKRARCFSCHHQCLGMLAVGIARERGFRIDEQMLAQEVAAVQARQRPLAESLTWLLPFGGASQDAMQIIALWSAGLGPDRKTDFAAYLLRGRQSAGGVWRGGGAPPRPPIASDAVGNTALAIRALRLSGQANRGGQTDMAIRRARNWLLKAEPIATTAMADQLFGLAWSEADRADLDRVRQKLLSEQRPDGGWAQIRTRESDAYATGLALMSLSQAGRLSVEAPAFRRGIEWLLRTQLADGTWLVRKRRTYEAGNPYLESGFPHGDNQFISYAGTAWATMALAISDKDQRARALMGTPEPGAKIEKADPEYEQFTPLMRAALFGTVEQMRVLVATGADVNAVATPFFLTALMCAAHDARKLELVLEAGADVNAKSKHGYTALLIAARYAGAAASVRLLLDRGADANTRSTRPSYFNSPLHHAVERGDRETITALLDAGAVLNDLPLGSSAFAKAVLAGDAPTVAFLLDRGAELEAPLSIRDKRNESTPLMWAVEHGFEDVVKVLIDRGADVNAADEMGWTPLIYAAASRDYGTTRIIEMLLNAGADINAVATSGESAFDLSDRYGKREAGEVLRAASLVRRWAHSGLVLCSRPVSPNARFAPGICATRKLAWRKPTSQD